MRQEITVTEPNVGAFTFGIELGVGYRTFVPSLLPYVTSAALILIAAWPAAILGGLGFALGRLSMAHVTKASNDPGAWWRSFNEPVQRERIERVLSSAGGLSIVLLLIARLG